VPQSTPYAAAWRAYRGWSRAFWLVFVTYLPALALSDHVVRRIYGDTANTITTVMAFVWMIAFVMTGYFKSNFACPRCGEMFFRTWDDRPWRAGWRSAPFARRCQHCGLSKWSDGERGLVAESRPNESD
jgi:hypothetical protein